jgi:hypothetical protein
MMLSTGDPLSLWNVGTAKTRIDGLAVSIFKSSITPELGFDQFPPPSK